MEQSTIRRKLAAKPPTGLAVISGAERDWPMALARAARDSGGLGLEVARLTSDARSLAELLDMPPDRALVAVLEGPAEGLGLMTLCPGLLAAMIEMQTMGRVAAQPPAPRKPTRTDAAMVAGFIDRALEGLEQALAEDADQIWAGGFRYASFLDDARPLGLLLEDAPYRVFQADVVLAAGARTGAVLLALPATGRGRRPVPPAAPVVDSPPQFQADLAAQVMAASCTLDAVLGRITLPLSALLALQPGDLLALPGAGVDRIGFEGLDGCKRAEGKLGQHRGMRAVRLATPAVAEPNVVPLRAAGAA